MRLELQRAYAAATLSQARERFTSWCRWVRTEAQALTTGLLEPMRKAADMVERHLEGILGHWKQGLTTAFLEGLNSLFSATKRKARELPLQRISNRYALLCSRQTGDPILLIPTTNVEEAYPGTAGIGGLYLQLNESRLH
jgi:hypothetical protein